MLRTLLQRYCMQQTHRLTRSLVRHSSGIDKVDSGIEQESMASPFDQCSENYKYVFQPALLKDKVALVTGGGSGIGFTITEILMRHGCRTAIASRNKAKTSEAAARLEKGTGGKCLPLAMDLRQPVEIIAAIEELLKEYGRIDILVNNAGYNFLAPLSTMSYDEYKSVLDINTMGTFNCSKTVYDQYFKDNGGVIVNMSSMLSHRGALHQAHSGSSKAAIDALTRHMAVEWGPENVRVVGLAPGPIADTTGMRNIGGVTGTVEEVGRVDYVPLRRFGDKREMAHAVLFLVSDACPYITGSTLTADGGAWMTRPTDEFSRKAANAQTKRDSKL